MAWVLLRERSAWAAYGGCGDTARSLEAGGGDSGPKDRAGSGRDRWFPSDGGVARKSIPADLRRAEGSRGFQVARRLRDVDGGLACGWWLAFERWPSTAGVPLDAAGCPSEASGGSVGAAHPGTKYWTRRPTTILLRLQTPRPPAMTRRDAKWRNALWFPLVGWAATPVALNVTASETARQVGKLPGRASLSLSEAASPCVPRTRWVTDAEVIRRHYL